MSGESVFGTLCGYLLIGVVFGHLYTLIETIAPGSFRAEAAFASQLRDPTRTHFALTYFSFATFTSLGTNDINPASPATRGVVMVEAIAGQFYIAVLIADLIGKKVSNALADQPARRDAR